MTKLDDKTLERYFDGELSKQGRKDTLELIQKSDASLAFLEKNQRLGDLIRLMDEEKTKGISFDGLSKRVLEASRQSAPTPWLERARVWFAEFFEHRRAIWIPAVAVGAAAVALLFIPLSTVQRGTSYEEGRGISLHSASSVVAGGSTIASVDFGGAKGTTYNLQNESGASVGVVWIVEKP